MKVIKVTVLREGPVPSDYFPKYYWRTWIKNTGICTTAEENMVYECTLKYGIF